MKSSNLIFKRASRKGAAFLLLVFLVLLVVLGATQVMVRSEVTTRQGEQSRLRVRSMAAAIDAAHRMDGDTTETVQFPVDEAANEFIEVSLDQDESTAVARWLRRDQLIDQMTQQLDQNVESGE